MAVLKLYEMREDEFLDPFAEKPISVMIFRILHRELIDLGRVAPVEWWQPTKQ